MADQSLAALLPTPLTDDQLLFLHVVYEGCRGRGAWPVWQYVDLMLDAKGIDAAEVLASLPRFGDGRPGMQTYGLTSGSSSSSYMEPDSIIRLTVAGLQLVPDAGPLLGAFLATVAMMVEAERSIVPSPAKEVTAVINRAAVHDQLLTASIGSGAAPPVDMTLMMLGELLSNEPFRPWSSMSSGGAGLWEIRLSTRLSSVRAMRGVVSIDDYVGRVVGLMTPPATPSVPHSIGVLDLAYACDYLDTVWKVKTGSRLFSDLHMASCVRLGQSCDSEEGFNSMMSALADVLACVVPPGRSSPPQTGALKALQESLPQGLSPESSDRIRARIEILLKCVKIRAGQQHGDARRKAVTAYGSLGISYPPYNWGTTWAQVATIAQGALDAIREEIQAGLPDT